ncbi:hypothetical protein B0H13DRAFT_2300284 [Mycena leptocephala]|nr:hypothetical protein B0H13DRAFT_2300284 [Mycena leptocephala]
MLPTHKVFHVVLDHGGFYMDHCYFVIRSTPSRPTTTRICCILPQSSRPHSFRFTPARSFRPGSFLLRLHSLLSTCFRHCSRQFFTGALVPPTLVLVQGTLIAVPAFVVPRPSHQRSFSLKLCLLPRACLLRSHLFGGTALISARLSVCFRGRPRLSSAPAVITSALSRPVPTTQCHLRICASHALDVTDFTGRLFMLLLQSSASLFRSVPPLARGLFRVRPRELPPSAEVLVFVLVVSNPVRIDSTRVWAPRPCFRAGPVPIVLVPSHVNALAHPTSLWGFAIPFRSRLCSHLSWLPQFRHPPHSTFVLCSCSCLRTFRRPVRFPAPMLATFSTRLRTRTP